MSSTYKAMCGHTLYFSECRAKFLPFFFAYIFIKMMFNVQNKSSNIYSKLCKIQPIFEIIGPFYIQNKEYFQNIYPLLDRSSHIPRVLYILSKLKNPDAEKTGTLKILQCVRSQFFSFINLLHGSLTIPDYVKTVYRTSD